MTAGTGLDGDAECLASLAQPLAPVAEITQGGLLEATAGKLMQHRDHTFAVMPTGWRDGDRKRKVVLFDAEMDLQAVDLLPTVKAALEAARRRMDMTGCR